MSTPAISTPPSASTTTGVFAAARLLQGVESEPAVAPGKSSGLVGVGGVLDWLRAKLAEAEKALRAREQMGQCLRSGTNASWDAAAKMHPSTANAPRMTKADRLRDAAAQDRIAERCLRDVDMFKLLLASLGGGGAELVTKDSGDTMEKPCNAAIIDSPTETSTEGEK